MTTNSGNSLFEITAVAEGHTEKLIEAVLLVKRLFLSHTIVHTAHEVALRRDQAATTHVPDLVELSAVDLDLSFGEVCLCQFKCLVFFIFCDVDQLGIPGGDSEELFEVFDFDEWLSDYLPVAPGILDLESLLVESPSNEGLQLPFWYRCSETNADLAVFWRLLPLLDEQLVCLIDQDDSIFVRLTLSSLDPNHSFQFRIWSLKMLLNFIPRLGILVPEKLVRPDYNDFDVFVLRPVFVQQTDRDSC